MRRIGDIDDRGPIKLLLFRYRVHRLWDRIRAAMMPDIGDPAITLVMNGRLISRASLQVIETDKPQI